MTLTDRFGYFIANNLYWVHLWAVVYPQILSSFFN